MRISPVNAAVTRRERAAAELRSRAPRESTAPASCRSPSEERVRSEESARAAATHRLRSRLSESPAGPPPTMTTPVLAIVGMSQCASLGGAYPVCTRFARRGRRGPFAVPVLVTLGICFGIAPPPHHAACVTVTLSISAAPRGARRDLRNPPVASPRRCPPPPSPAEEAPCPRRRART